MAVDVDEARADDVLLCINYIVCLAKVSSQFDYPSLLDGYIGSVPGVAGTVDDFAFFNQNIIRQYDSRVILRVVRV